MCVSTIWAAHFFPCDVIHDQPTMFQPSLQIIAHTYSRVELFLDSYKNTMQYIAS